MCRASLDVDSLVLSLIESEKVTLAVTQAACALLKAQPDISPHDAVDDVLQVYRYAAERLYGPRQ